MVSPPDKIGWGNLHPSKNGAECFLQQKICLRISFKNPSSCQKIEKLPSWPNKTPRKSSKTRNLSGRSHTYLTHSFHEGCEPFNLRVWCFGACAARPSKEMPSFQHSYQVVGSFTQMKMISMKATRGLR